MFILYFFAILFILMAIYLGIRTIKEKDLTGSDAFKTFIIYMFFGIFMALFCIFININFVVSIIIFLCLFWIGIISSMIESKKISFVVFDLFICTICIIFLLILPVPENIFELSYFSIFLLFLVLGLYLMPLLSCFDKKRGILKKINKCTYEVNAKVIDVIYYKKRGIYIPKLEFEFNGKKYKYSDTDTLYFSNEIKIGEFIPLLINPEVKKYNKNNSSVFFPGKEIDEFMSFSVKVWYIVTIIIFIIFLILYYV